MQLTPIPQLIKPKQLTQGDVIGLITPASAPKDFERVEKAQNYLRSIGYNISVGTNVCKKYGYLAGSDSERLSDLLNMFANPEIKAIISLRGGYGSGRLISQLDFELIKTNPKIFVGYSDITSLQQAILAQTGLVTFAGPMGAVDFVNDISAFTTNTFWRTITSTQSIGEVLLPDGVEIKALVPGSAEGRLIGGNMALFNALLGTPYFPNPDNAIIFLEDVGEPPYRIDRMLNQMKNAGIFASCAGVILGAFTNCTESDPSTPTLSKEEVFNHYLGDLKVPVVTDFPSGHIKDMVTLPFGAMVSMETAQTVKVSIIESVVS